VGQVHRTVVRNILEIIEILRIEETHGMMNRIFISESLHKMVLLPER